MDAPSAEASTAASLPAGLLGELVRHGNTRSFRAGSILISEAT